MSMYKIVFSGIGRGNKEACKVKCLDADECILQSRQKHEDGYMTPAAVGMVQHYFLE